MQMVLGAFVSKAIWDVTRLNVPDVLKQHGAATAAEMVACYGVGAKPDFLERALRACSSVGLFTEDAAGRFGPKALSEVLTSDSIVSVKAITELFGATGTGTTGRRCSDDTRAPSPESARPGDRGLPQSESENYGGVWRGDEILFSPNEAYRQSAT